MNDTPGRALKPRRRKPYQAVRKFVWFVVLMLTAVYCGLWLVLQIQQFSQVLFAPTPIDIQGGTFISPITTERVVTPEGVFIRIVDEDYGVYCLHLEGSTGDPDCIPMASDVELETFQLRPIPI